MSTSPKKNVNTPADHVASFLASAAQATDLTAVTGRKPKHEPMVELFNQNAALQLVTMTSADKVRANPSQIVPVTVGNTFTVHIGPGERYRPLIPIKSVDSASVADTDIRIIAYWWDDQSQSFTV